MKRFGAKAIILVALIAVLVAGTALAVTRSWGVLDFQNQSVTTLPEANEVVADLTGEPAVSSEMVRYQLQDAMLVEKHLKLTVVAEPTDVNKYILADDWASSQCTVPGTDKTCWQLAQETGRTVARTGFTSMKVNGINTQIDASQQVLEGNKVITYLSVEKLLGDLSGEVQVECTFFDNAVLGVREVEEDVEGEKSVRLDEDWGEENEVTLRFSITADAGKQETVRFKGPFPCEYMDIQWVEMTRTPAATYLNLRYTVHEDIPQEVADQLIYMGIQWVDGPDGTEFKGGGGTLGQEVGTTGWDDSGNDFYIDEHGESHYAPQGRSYMDRTEYDAIGEFPEVIYLRPFYKEMGKWGRAIELKLSERLREDEDAAAYYMTNAGKYYHAQGDCSGMEGARQVTLAEAQLAGRIECPICCGK